MVLTAKDVTTLHYCSQFKVDVIVDRYNNLGFPMGDIQFTSTSHFFLVLLDSCYTLLNTDVCATTS